MSKVEKSATVTNARISQQKNELLHVEICCTSQNQYSNIRKKKFLKILLKLHQKLKYLGINLTKEMSYMLKTLIKEIKDFL